MASPIGKFRRFWKDRSLVRRVVGKRLGLEVHRRSIHSGLRHIESTNDNLSSRIISEVEKLFEKLDQKLHTPIDLSEGLTALSARVVCSVAFGRRFDSFAETKSFADFLLGVKLVAKQFSVFSLAIIFPRLYDTFLYREVRTSVQYIKTFLSDMLREHKEAFKDGICDVMDAYCDVMANKPIVIIVLRSTRGIFGERSLICWELERKQPRIVYCGE
ncbi:putative cytochrome P450 2U1 [Apostichopus japonicus]|uniref:Putative cytochrome P450 2U1 n=1 Tax=Stichopus japonicus TaxID=307972 RepID=A0A2G8JWD7_STIJA|nr:putative cytochrome P450 2U1 [Apostichopus japonicus]